MYHNILLILNLFLLEGILSVDNAAVLAIMVKDLPAEQSKKALKYGLIGAYVFRGLCLLVAQYLMGMWVLKILGGLYLAYLVFGFFSKKVEMVEETKDKNESGLYKWLSKIGISQFVATVILVEWMDLAFSVDNIFAAVALSNQMWVVLSGVFMGIAAMRFIAGWFVTVMGKYPVLERSAFIVIGLLAVKLVVSGVAQGFAYRPILEVLENHWSDLIFSAITMCIFFWPIAVSKIR